MVPTTVYKLTVTPEIPVSDPSNKPLPLKSYQTVSPKVLGIYIPASMVIFVAPAARLKVAEFPVDALGSLSVEVVPAPVGEKL